MYHNIELTCPPECPAAPFCPGLPCAPLSPCCPLGPGKPPGPCMPQVGIILMTKEGNDGIPQILVFQGDQWDQVVPPPPIQLCDIFNHQYKLFCFHADISLLVQSLLADLCFHPFQAIHLYQVNLLLQVALTGPNNCACNSSEVCNDCMVQLHASSLQDLQALLGGQVHQVIPMQFRMLNINVYEGI